MKLIVTEIDALEPGVKEKLEDAGYMVIQVKAGRRFYIVDEAVPVPQFRPNIAAAREAMSRIDSTEGP
jgi:hypothetical protein